MSEGYKAPPGVMVSPDELVAMGARKAVEQMTIRPIPLSERKPGPDDCLEIKNQSWTMHYCWLGYSILHAGIERCVWNWRAIPMGAKGGWEEYTHWLPVSVRYLPTRMEG